MNIQLQLSILLTKIKKRLTDTNPEQKEKIISGMYAILTIFTVAFFGLFAINPTLGTITTLQTQLEQTQELKKSMENKIEALGKLDSAYKTNEQSFSNLLSAITLSPDIPALTRKLEKIAKITGVSLSRLSFGSIEIYPANKKNPSLYSFTFSLQTTGPNSNIDAFIDKFINFDRLVFIESISKENTEGETPTVNISAKVYFNR